MKRAMIGVVALLSACGTRTEIVQRPSDEVVMRVRVRDDLAPAPAPEPAPTEPRCEGPGPDGQPTSSLTMGYAHACVVLGNGTVRCWGSNHSGSLGDGTAGRRATPVEVLDLHDATSVGAGRMHTCALRRTGHVVCWGGNGWGQVGAPTEGTLSRRPLEVRGLRGAAQVGVGRDHSCAVSARGQVSCWGANRSGQLGGGRRDRSVDPERVRGLRASWVGAGHDSTCAVRMDGGVSCWGALVRSERPVHVDGLPGPAVTVEVGRAAACARLADGSVWCWGDGSMGTLGPEGLGYVETPVQVAGLPPATSLSLNDTVACAADAQGGAWCWGSHEGMARELSEPRLRGYMAPASQVMTAERDAACALLAEGNVCCWGDNRDGLLGALASPFANPGPYSELPVPMVW